MRAAGLPGAPRATRPIQSPTRPAFAGWRSRTPEAPRTLSARRRDLSSTDSLSVRSKDVRFPTFGRRQKASGATTQERDVRLAFFEYEIPRRTHQFSSGDPLVPKDHLRVHAAVDFRQDRERSHEFQVVRLEQVLADDRALPMLVGPPTE